MLFSSDKSDRRIFLVMENQQGTTILKGRIVRFPDEFLKLDKRDEGFIRSALVMALEDVRSGEDGKFVLISAEFAAWV